MEKRYSNFCICSFIKVMDITIKFDAERRQSRRLNEQVLNHSETCKHEKQVLFYSISI